jgi:tellurite resistance protein
MPDISSHDALIYIMITMSAADRKMQDIELHKIAEIVKDLPVFRDFDHNNLARAAVACGNILSEEDGLDKLMEIIVDTLPKKLYETAYALAVEVAAADLRVPDEEVRLLELIKEALHLDKLVTAAIERSARARYQTI